MKRGSASWREMCFFMAALSCIVAGSVLFAGMFSRLDQLFVYHEINEQLFGEIRQAVFWMMIYGCIVAVGIGLLIVLFLHTSRGTLRRQREAEALRQKNAAVEALNNQIQQLAHHQRLETIGTLTSSIAHEFNNLLTPIMGYSMMALEKLPPEQEELYDGILEIYEASKKAKTIISRLSDLSRKNTSQSFRPVAIDEIVRKTLDVVTPAKPPGVQVKLDLNCWDQRLYANEIQINQLLLNLIINGFHAMGEEGTLTLSTGFDETYIHIRVEDTGCGIPEEILSKIFQPFFTTKETGRGTGLGLAIAAQVAEDHNGTIAVESHVGIGTCFTVSLPRLRDSQNAQ